MPGPITLPPDRAVELFRENNEHVLEAIPLLEFGWLVHGFGTRRSHVWNGQPNLVTLKQTHSDNCILISQHPSEVLYGDALLTAAPGLMIGVRTADCVPILLVDPRHRAVGAVHAGWRGTAGRVAVKAMEKMQRDFGGSPGEILAAIGPSIGPCCYRVGAEVAVLFREWFPERNDLEGPVKLDLAEANRRQLIAAGLRDAHIFQAQLCTACLKNNFFSYRREGKTAGRQIAAIGIKGPA